MKLVLSRAYGVWESSIPGSGQDTKIKEIKKVVMTKDATVFMITDTRFQIYFYPSGSEMLLDTESCRVGVA